MTNSLTENLKEYCMEVKVLGSGLVNIFPKIDTKPDCSKFRIRTKLKLAIILDVQHQKFYSLFKDGHVTCALTYYKACSQAMH